MLSQFTESSVGKGEIIISLPIFDGNQETAHTITSKLYTKHNLIKVVSIAGSEKKEKICIIISVSHHKTPSESSRSAADFSLEATR